MDLQQKQNRVVDTHQPGQASKIAYMLDRFPVLSQTFVLQEIRELERQGLLLFLFCLSEPVGREDKKAVWDGLAAITYISHQSLWSLLAMAIYRCLRAPWRFLHTCIALVARYRLRSALGYLLYGSYLARQLEHEGISHIHAHFATDPAAVVQSLHWLTGISYSFTAHAFDIYVDIPNRSKAFRRSSKVILGDKIRMARFVVTCSAYNQRYLTEIASGSAQHIYSIYYGVNLEALSPHVPIASMPLRPPLILAVARLIEKKGLSYLVQACRFLADQGYDFTCRIVGAGPLQQALEDEIDKLELTNRVRLWGAAAHQEVIAMYQEATIAALPCIVAKNDDRDGMPNVLIEALCMGIPVVSTFVSGIPELIESEVNGLLVPPQDSTALALALARLLDNPSLRDRLASAGQQSAHERFDITKNAKCLLDLLCTQREIEL